MPKVLHFGHFCLTLPTINAIYCKIRSALIDMRCRCSLNLWGRDWHNSRRGMMLWVFDWYRNRDTIAVGKICVCDWYYGESGGCLGPSLEYGAGCAAGHSVLSPPPCHHITPSGTLGPRPRSHQDLGHNVQIWQCPICRWPTWICWQRCCCSSVAWSQHLGSVLGPNFVPLYPAADIWWVSRPEKPLRQVVGHYQVDGKLTLRIPAGHSAQCCCPTPSPPTHRSPTRRRQIQLSGSRIQKPQMGPTFCFDFRHKNFGPQTRLNLPRLNVC